MSKSITVRKSNVVESDKIDVYEGKCVELKGFNRTFKLNKDLSSASEIIINGKNIIARFKSDIYVIVLIFANAGEGRITLSQTEVCVPVRIKSIYEYVKYRKLLICKTDFATYSHKEKKNVGYYGTRMGSNDKYKVTVFHFTGRKYCLIIYNKSYDVIGLRLMEFQAGEKISDMSVVLLEDMIILKSTKSKFTITVEDENSICPVCFDPPDVFCVPCGHQLCRKCYVNLVGEGCPECRRTITNYIAAKYDDNKEISKYVYNQAKKLKKAKQETPNPEPEPSPKDTS